MTYDTGYSSSNSYNETTGLLKVKSTPWRDMTGDNAWPTNYSVAVYANVPDVENGCLMAFGSSVNGGNKYLALIRGASSNEIKLVKGNGQNNPFEVIATMSAENATVAKHLVVFTKSGSTFKVYCDGVNVATTTYNQTLGTGFQIGSIHGGVPGTGIIRINDNSVSSEVKDAVEVQSIRIFDGVLNDDQMSALMAEFPYVSNGGSYRRTITTDANLREDNAWIKSDETTHHIPTSVIDNGATYYPDVTITASADATLTVNEDATFGKTSFGGSGTLTIAKDANGHSINVVGAVIVNSDVIVKFGAIDMSTSPVTKGGDATLTFDFSGYDFSDVYDETTFVVTGNTSDYGNKVTHELGGIYIPGAVHKNYTQTWEDIDRLLLGDSEFGGRLKKSSPLKAEIASSGILSISDKRERIAAVFQLLKSRVRWNGNYAFWGKPASKVLSEGTGTNADINFLLINMLQDAGIESFPVVLRNRDLGVMPRSHASLKYLSSFVVGVQETDSTFLFIDGSVEDGYLNVLPPSLLVSRARVIQKNGSGYWVNIQSYASGEETTVIEGHLNADGLMTCKKRRNLMGETAASLRKEWRTAKDSMEMIGKIQERDGIEVTRYQIDGKKDFSSKVRETMEFTKQFDATGDKIYINPLVTAPMKDSPFTDATRDLPVEFPFRQSEAVSVVINLPEGYEVEEMPQPFVMKMDGLTVQVLGTVKGSRIQMRYKTTIDKTFYSQADYQELKTVFDQLVEHANYMLVIKKES